MSLDIYSTQTGKNSPIDSTSLREKQRAENLNIQTRLQTASFNTKAVTNTFSQIEQAATSVYEVMRQKDLLEKKNVFLSQIDAKKAEEAFRKKVTKLETRNLRLELEVDQEKEKGILQQVNYYSAGADFNKVAALGQTRREQIISNSGLPKEEIESLTTASRLEHDQLINKVKQKQAAEIVGSIYIKDKQAFEKQRNRLQRSLSSGDISLDEFQDRYISLTKEHGESEEEARKYYKEALVSQFASFDFLDSSDVPKYLKKIESLQKTGVFSRNEINDIIQNTLAEEATDYREKQVNKATKDVGKLIKTFDVTPIRLNSREFRAVIVEEIAPVLKEEGLDMSRPQDAEEIRDKLSPVLRARFFSEQEQEQFYRLLEMQPEMLDKNMDKRKIFDVLLELESEFGQRQGMERNRLSSKAEKEIEKLYQMYDYELNSVADDDINGDTKISQITALHNTRVQNLAERYRQRYSAGKPKVRFGSEDDPLFGIKDK